MAYIHFHGGRNWQARGLIVLGCYALTVSGCVESIATPESTTTLQTSAVGDVTNSTDGGDAAAVETTNSQADSVSLDSSADSEKVSAMPAEKKLETATFANGCFWCTEAVFQRLKGVDKVVSGYMGGAVDDPTYEQVCSGRTGHAECIQVTFDPQQIPYKDLLEVFWKTHDPTTLNRQGNDVGTQYRSAIFFHSDQQRDAAADYKKKLDEANVFDNPIVTEISAASKFYPAEKYHQNYFNLNGARNPYCTYVIVPKVEKLHKVFADKLKDEVNRYE